MDKNEIALKIVLAMIEKGIFTSQGNNSNTDYGKAAGELFNAVKSTISY
jgi:hypothetical protein